MTRCSGGGVQAGREREGAPSQGPHLVSLSLDDSPGLLWLELGSRVEGRGSGVKGFTACRGEVEG
eukprot:1028135-Rhodomonas_salina.4